MNILNRKTAHVDKDPFHQSDRDPFRPSAGKGDRPRNIGPAFQQNFPNGMGKKRCKPGRTIFRYGK